MCSSLTIITNIITPGTIRTEDQAIKCCTPEGIKHAVDESEPRKAPDGIDSITIRILQEAQKKAMILFTSSIFSETLEDCQSYRHSKTGQVARESPGASAVYYAN